MLIHRCRRTDSRPDKSAMAIRVTHCYTRPMASNLLSDIMQLSVSERIQLVQDIWDSISAASEDLALTDAQREELDRRLDDLEANPSAGVPWQDVKARLTNRR